MFNPKAPLLTDKRPKMTFSYHPRLVEMGYWQWRATDFSKRPTPEEVAYSDEAWMQDLSTFAELVAFHQDGGKNPGPGNKPDDDDDKDSE